MARKLLTDDELLQIIEEGLSDIECMSDDDDEADLEEDIPQFPEELEDMLQEIEEPEQDNLNEIEKEVDLQEENQSEPSVVTKRSKIQIVNDFIENNELTNKKDINWRKGLTYLTPTIKWHQEQILEDIAELESPYYFFRQYFTDDIFERMVEFTNLYAIQKDIDFTCTSVEEMKTFVGIHILMGNLHYPRIRCYWEPNLQVPSISTSMPVNRFSKIRQLLQFVDVTDPNPDNKDRMWKIRPLYDCIRTKCLSLPLETQLCIDEQMVPFKGKINIKQYVKNKPKPWGIKIFALFGSSGIIYDFIIYQGATTELNDVESQVFGLGGSVITALSKRITEPNFELFYDNYFSNYNVLQYLRSRRIYAAGTARVDRFRKPPFSSDGEMKRRGRGSCEEVISNDGEVIMTKWFDNKPVIMASNYLGIGETDQCRRWDKTLKQYVEVPRPTVIKQYNAHMGGVDKLDYLITIYRISIRTRKWTLRMFAHAIDLSCANAWLEYRKKATAVGVQKKKILDLLHFRAYVAEVLMKASKTPTRKRGRPSSLDPQPGPSTPKTSRGRLVETRPLKEVRLDGMNHLPTSDGKKNSSRCKFPKCKRKSRIMCNKCNIHLCLSKKFNCFVTYHLSLNVNNNGQ